MSLSNLDFSIVGIYAVALIAIALWISREPKGHSKDSEDYFLAGKSLPWWAIGASLIAANISAEQIIGMSGSGFAVGLAIASYEWTAAIALLLVGKFLLPIYLENGITTMPQYLEKRYNSTVKSVMATFWLGVYVFVNLTAILWLGALAINTLTGLEKPIAIAGLAVFAAAYSLYGGLKAVALTDIIQVVILVVGGILIAWITLDAVADGGGPIAGFGLLMAELPEKFDMILSKDNPEYANLPGLGVLLGGMWVMHMSYWGFNQYIIQRALGAKSVREAQAGIVFAGFLKLFMPLIIVVPGIAAAMLAPGIDRPDNAYPEMMKLAPNGIRGLIFAALIAAIVSSVGSMMNSISTIFTLDIYKPLRPNTSEQGLVTVGRLTSLTALIIAGLAAQPLLGSFDQAFQYIQEFTGFFTPGIVAIFVIGMVWKGANAAGALVGAIGSAVLSLLFRLYLPDVPFMDRVGYVFLACCVLTIVVSQMKPAGEGQSTITLAGVSFETDARFNLSAVIITAALIGLYGYYW
ncbi:MAG: sodium/sugar symporter [Lysobacterales bacterium]